MEPLKKSGISDTLIYAETLDNIAPKPVADSFRRLPRLSKTESARVMLPHIPADKSASMTQATTKNKVRQLKIMFDN
jgi:hypothetical protein